MPETVPHYQNYSLADIEGESWKDIPGLENIYQISCFGRVKRLGSKGFNKQGYSFSKPEKIMSQILIKSWNEFTKDYRYYLRVSLTLPNANKAKQFTIARLVYNCFVQEFSLEDKNLFIFYKDGNTLNACFENLELGNQADKQARMEASGRRGNPFADIAPERRKEIQVKINQIKAEKGAHTISRYSLSGQRIATYANAAEAARRMKTSAEYLSNAARGKSGVFTACGYLWRRGNAPAIDLAPLLESKRFRRSPLAKKQSNIGQYDLDGNLIKTYSTIKEASLVSKIHYNSIQEVISGRALTSGGFLWREGVKPKINVKSLSKHDGYRNSILSVDSRRVSQYTLDGIWVKTFNTITEASKATSIDNKSITQVVKGERMTAGGFLWQQGSALRININLLRKSPCFSNSALEKYLKEKRKKKLEKQ